MSKSSYIGSWPMACLCAILLFVAHQPLLAQDGKKEYTVDDALEDLREWYEETKETGAETSSELYDYLKEKIKHANTWEYHVIGISNSELHTVGAKMNELGQERWECIQVQQIDNKMILFFKRPTMQSLKAIPFADMLRLMTITRSMGSQ